MPCSRLANFDYRRERQIRVAKIPLTRLRDRQNPLEWFNAVEFKIRYHMYKETAIFITDLISQDLSYRVPRGVYIPPVIQFLTVLRFYATGNFQTDNADLHQMSQPTISNLVKRVSKAIAKLRGRLIHFPSFQEADKVQQEFYKIAGFPGVIGSIDCTHIHIISPGGDDAELFRNRKGRFSVNVQATCDASLCFTNVVARWYGSAHDSRIFENSLLFDDLQNGRSPGLLVGDGGYPLLPFLLTPFEPPRTPSE
ncbi:putative nuclease HARBI1 [Folsomia candida]|uniref:Putative nuclease HARBI1 n=1 Tax=Folsomia candida TaxID=158441 RepID=A0A226D554_FOLCA|nr:putative nuclease HARBI1 [Folsomia candida]OXA40695.1 putative nuclease HARBI1 [Folsomia candida]